MTVRVLLVEDMKHVHGALADLLSEVGEFPVVHATGTEAEAKLWLAENPGAWDLAIVDLVLEQGAGMNVIRRCRQDAQGGRVVVFSSYATPGVRKHCLELGADAVFDKGETADFISWLGDFTSRENSGP